jgi:hypothetical protein
VCIYCYFVCYRGYGVKLGTWNLERIEHEHENEQANLQKTSSRDRMAQVCLCSKNSLMPTRPNLQRELWHEIALVTSSVWIPGGADSVKVADTTMCKSSLPQPKVSCVKGKLSIMVHCFKTEGKIICHGHCFKTCIIKSV